MEKSRGTQQELGRTTAISLSYFADPAFGSFFGSHLDACECFAEFFEDWADFIHAAWDIDFCAVVIDATDWADYSSCAAQADFYEILKLALVDLTLFDC